MLVPLELGLEGRRALAQVHGEIPWHEVGSVPRARLHVLSKVVERAVGPVRPLGRRTAPDSVMFVTWEAVFDAAFFGDPQLRAITCHGSTFYFVVSGGIENTILLTCL